MKALKEKAESGELLNCNILNTYMKRPLSADYIVVEWEFFLKLQKTSISRTSDKTILALFAEFQNSVDMWRALEETHPALKDGQTHSQFHFIFTDDCRIPREVRAEAIEEDGVRWLLFTEITR